MSTLTLSNEELTQVTKKAEALLDAPHGYQTVFRIMHKLQLPVVSLGSNNLGPETVTLPLSHLYCELIGSSAATRDEYR